MKIKTAKDWRTEGTNCKANAQYDDAIACYNKAIEYFSHTVIPKMSIMS